MTVIPVRPPLCLPASPKDFLLSSYNFALAEELIAQHPAPERAASRLMVLDRCSGATQTARFSDLPDFLPEGCLVVANNSRVVPARMWGTRPGGGKVEVLLLTPPPLLERDAERDSDGTCRARAEALLRPAKKVRPGDLVRVSEGLSFELLERGDFGRCSVSVIWRGDLNAELDLRGVMPLPPYIRRDARPGGTGEVAESEARKSAAQQVMVDEAKGGTGRAEQSGPGETVEAGRAAGSGEAPQDRERYQTTYARQDKCGSVAAPTAGLHFTPELQSALRASGREWAEVTLYVGYGTFSPVRCRDIREHPMHAEYVEVPETTAAMVRRAKAEGRAVIAVGTTSARTLEGAFLAQNSNQTPTQTPARTQGGSEAARLQAHAGWINVFLYPGRPFHVIDGLITNFHLPESSLLMLVSALAGREQILRAYERAVRERFRFFSYGDAMLIR